MRRRFTTKELKMNLRKMQDRHFRQHGLLLHICKCGARFCSGCGYGLNMAAVPPWVLASESERMVQ